MIKCDEQTLEQHFPTPVMTLQYSGTDALNRDISEFIDTLTRELEPDHKNQAPLAENTTQGGYQTMPSLNVLHLPDPSMQQLKAEIVLPAIEHYLDQVLKVDPFFTPIEIHSWAVSLGPGDWQAPHLHPKEYTLMSGIYYVSIPTSPHPEGTLEFINPNPVSVSLGQQDATRNYRPKDSTVVLFPPYYMHYVHPIRAEGKRRIIAFDARLAPNT